MLKPDLGVFEVLVFFGSVGTPQCPVAVRKAAEALDDFQVAIGIIESYRIAILKESDCLPLVIEIFAVLEGQIDEIAFERLQPSIFPTCDELLSKSQSLLVTCEGAWIIAEQVTRKLIEDDYQSQA